jgi:uncharacterized protein YbjT (DUF2867 family)
MSNILITGATGNVGSQVVNELNKQGVKVKAGVRSIEKATALQGENVTLVEFDTARAETLKAALNGIETLFLLPPLVADMVGYTRDLVNRAKEAGVQYIVKLSGIGAGPEGIQLARWHWATEKLIEDSGIAFTHLRPTSFMQNYVNNAAATIKSQNAFYLPQGDGKISLIDTRDIATVAAIVLTSRDYVGQTIELTGGEALSNYEIAQIFSDVTGRPINYVDVPPAAAQQAMSSAGMPDWLVEAILELNAIIKAGYTAGISPAVREITGRAPITFRQFAQDYATAF